MRHESWTCDRCDGPIEAHPGDQLLSGLLKSPPGVPQGEHEQSVQMLVSIGRETGSNHHRSEVYNVDLCLVCLNATLRFLDPKEKKFRTLVLVKR